MSTWTNAQFMKWLTEARVSSLSQEHLKIEAEKFSGKFEDLDKKTIAKVVENFEKEHKKVRACLVNTSMFWLSIVILRIYQQTTNEFLFVMTPVSNWCRCQIDSFTLLVPNLLRCQIVLQPIMFVAETANNVCGAKFVNCSNFAPQDKSCA